MSTATGTPGVGPAADVANFRAMTEKALAAFDAAHGDDLKAAGLAVAFAGGVAASARAVFDACDALVADVARLRASGDYSADYLASARASARDTAAVVWERELTDFDEGLGRLVALAATAAYPKLPTGADEAALWAEAADVLAASAHPPAVALINLARAERRDLAAVALSPRAASWAGTQGLKPVDLQRVRALAIEATKTLGTPREQAAARVYTPALRLLGWRAALTGAIEVAAEAAVPGGRVPFTLRAPLGDAPNLLDWHEGPADGPPIVVV